MHGDAEAGGRLTLVGAEGPRGLRPWLAASVPALVITLLVPAVLALLSPQDPATARSGPGEGGRLVLSIAPVPPAALHSAGGDGGMRPAAGRGPGPLQQAGGRPAARAGGESQAALAGLGGAPGLEILGSGLAGGGRARAGAKMAGSRSTAGAGKGATAAALRSTAPGERAAGRGAPRGLRRTSVKESAGLEGPASTGPPARRVVSAPVATRQPGPKYPDKAIRNEAEGFVRVRVLIGENGAVKSHEILEAEPAGVFEESLESVVPLWQFTPALDEAGRPMEFWKEYKYVFKLEVGS